MEEKGQTPLGEPEIPNEQDSTHPSPSETTGEPVTTRAASENAAEPVPKNVPPPRGPKRRTKTGCLICRKRRIKCGEEKPRCNNCIKAKRECEGYTRRVIFKYPLGPFGTFHPALGADMAMGLPLFPQQQGQPPAGQALGPQQRPLAPRIPHFPPVTGIGFSTLPQTSSVHGNPDNQPQPFYYPPVYEPTPSQILPSHPPQAFTPVTEGHESEEAQSSRTGQPTLQQNLNNPGSSYQLAQLVSQPVPALPILAQYHTSLFHANRAEIQDFPPQGQFSSLGFDGEAIHTSPIIQTLSSPTTYFDDQSDDYYDVDTDEEIDETTQEEGYNQLSLIMASANQDDRMIRSYTTFLNEPNILASYHPSIGSSPLNNPKTARIWVHFIHATGPSLSIWERHNTNSSILFSGPVPIAQQGLWNYTMPLRSLEHPALLQAILAISSLHIAKLQQAPLTISLKHYHYALRRIGKAVGLPLRRNQVSTLAATLVLAFYEVIAAEHSKWNSHVAGAAQLIKEIDFAGITRDLRAHRRNVKAQREQWWGGYGDFARYGLSEEDQFAEKEADINEKLINTIIGKVVDYDRFGKVETERLRSGGGKKHFTRKDIENFRLQCDLYWWYCKQDLFQSMISGNRLYLPFDCWDQCPPRAGLGQPDALYGSFDHLVLLMARMIDFGFRDRKRKIKNLEATGGEWRPHSELFRFMTRFGGKLPGQGAPGGPPQSDVSGAAAGLASSYPSMNSSRSAQKTSDYFGQIPAAAGPSAGPPPGISLGKGPMYGMMPSSGPSDLPAAFASTAYASNSLHSGIVDDGTERTSADAEAEWESILATFEVYARELRGPGFAALPPDSAPPIGTPFGQALQYRSHQVAVLWAFYFAARIVLHRLHPCMPPAAMVAASVAAPTTAQYAQTVGKIVAGIYYPQRYDLEAGSLNPTLGAALTEMTVPIFFAGVQFTDAAQRGWTVAKLRTIARLTGWQSAAAIASGCEAAWYFAAKAGRGPPYSSYEATGVLDEERRRRLQRSQEADKQVALDPNNDRRFVTVDKSRRAHWAMGLLEMEDDLVSLHLDDQHLG